MARVIESGISIRTKYAACSFVFVVSVAVIIIVTVIVKNSAHASSIVFWLSVVIIIKNVLLAVDRVFSGQPFFIVMPRKLHQRNLKEH